MPSLPFTLVSLFSKSSAHDQQVHDISNVLFRTCSTFSSFAAGGLNSILHKLLSNKDWIHRDWIEIFSSIRRDGVDDDATHSPISGVFDYDYNDLSFKSESPRHGSESTVVDDASNLEDDNRLLERENLKIMAPLRLLGPVNLPSSPSSAPRKTDLLPSYEDSWTGFIHLPDFTLLSSTFQVLEAPLSPTELSGPLSPSGLDLFDFSDMQDVIPSLVPAEPFFVPLVVDDREVFWKSLEPLLFSSSSNDCKQLQSPPQTSPTSDYGSLLVLASPVITVPILARL